MIGTGSKRIIVFGGAGFIGRQLVDRLVSVGAQVMVVDHRMVGHEDTVAVIDDQDQRAILRAFEAADVCFNLAIGNDTMNNIATFAKISKNLLPTVYASSAAVYGPQPASRPISEAAGRNAISRNGREKIALEDFARSTGE